MDELLQDFLVETNENLDVVDVELVRFEQEPNNAKILANIFRIVHTIKGTCGFIGLPRLEALAHAAESLMAKFRDGAPVTGEAVTLVLSSIDRIKEILTGIEKNEKEPPGDDADLIASLTQMAQAVVKAAQQPAVELGSSHTVGTLVPQVLERPLRLGEVPLDELERAFRSAPGPAPAAPAVAPAKTPPSRPESKKATVES